MRSANLASLSVGVSQRPAVLIDGEFDPALPPLLAAVDAA